MCKILRCACAHGVKSEILQVENFEADSCSDSGYQQFNRNSPMFLLKKWQLRLLLLLKFKSDCGSGSVFSQIFDSGSERKTQNPARVDSGTQDPWSPLASVAIVEHEPVFGWRSNRILQFRTGFTKNLYRMRYGSQKCVDHCSQMLNQRDFTDIKRIG